jgi:phosphonate transport system substrate-binding protein
MKLFNVALLAFLFTLTSAHAGQAKEYIFGVFPYMPLNKLYAVHSPMADDISKNIDIPVVIRSTPSFESFRNALRREEYDIAFIQPFDYPEAHDRHGYLPLARRSAALRNILLVRKDSPLTSIDDIRGKLIAAPAPSAAVTRILRYEFRKNHIDDRQDVRWLYKHNHFSCMQSVLVKEADACTTTVRALKHWESVRLEERFKVIYRSETFPHTLMVVHKRVPKATRDIIRQTILNWQNTESGKQILKHGNLIPFTEAKDSDYDVVRRFGKEE